MSEQDTQQQDSQATETQSEGFTIGEEYISDGKILGRFENTQALLDAVAAAGEPGQRQDAPADEAPAPAPQAQKSASADLRIPDAEAEGAPQKSFVEYYREAQANGGKLSDEAYAELEQRGFSRDIVDDHFQGFEARRQLAKMEIANAVGGEQKIQEAFAWAQKNLSRDKIEALNRDLDNSSVETQKAIIQGLVAQAGIKRGGSRSVAGAGDAPTGATPFRNRAEFEAAVADPRYTDPVQGEDYRNEVMRRRAASKL